MLRSSCSSSSSIVPRLSSILSQSQSYHSHRAIAATELSQSQSYHSHRQAQSLGQAGTVSGRSLSGWQPGLWLCLGSVGHWRPPSPVVPAVGQAPFRGEAPPVEGCPLPPPPPPSSPPPLAHWVEEHPPTCRPPAINGCKEQCGTGASRCTDRRLPNTPTVRPKKVSLCKVPLLGALKAFL